MGFIREVRNDIEREALRLMRGYYSMLLAEAKRLCGDDQTAEDLAMKAVETYLAKPEDELPSEDKTGAWLRAAVRNHYQNSIRGKARACTVYVDQTDAERLAELGPVDNSTDEAILAHSDAELVRSAIARLPPDVRSIIMLRYFESLPIRQIAEIIRRSPDSVRSNLYYARKVLAKRLGKMMGRAALAIAAVLFGGSLVYAAAVAVGLAPSLFTAAEPAAEAAPAESTEVSEGSLTGLSANQESQTTGAYGDSPQVVAEVTDNFNTNKEENAMNGSIVKKSAAKLVAAAAVLSAGTALSGSASIVPVPGYEMLTYLESSGTQYIDTGVVYANDTKLTQRFCVVDFAGVQMQMGALDSISGAWHRFHWGAKGQATLQYVAGVGIGGNPGNISAGSDGWVDLTLDATSAGSAFTESGHSTIGLFGRNSGGTFTCGKFRVGHTCIWKGGNLVRNMVPVRRKSDGVLGFYDYCEPKFYENGGSGEFAAGPAMKYLVVAKAIPDSLQSIDSPVEAYYPLPVVKDNAGRTLTKDVDYTVAWTDNTRFGEGTCTVIGAGDYANVEPVSATFLIVPQAKLPQEFQRLFYLETTGTVHYVDTDIHPTANTRITALAQTTVNATAHIVGIIDNVSGISGKRFHLTVKYSSGFYMTGGVGSGESQDISSTSPLKLGAGWNKLTMDAVNKTLSVNDGTTYALGTSGTLPTESTLRIFGRMSNSSEHNVGNPVRIADVVVYESGEKTHEFIPCRRKSDGVLGLYDVVDKLFLVNSGSAEGGFLAGPELKDDWVSGFIYIVR